MLLLQKQCRNRLWELWISLKLCRLLKMVLKLMFLIRLLDSSFVHDGSSDALQIKPLVIRSARYLCITKVLIFKVSLVIIREACTISKKFIALKAYSCTASAAIAYWEQEARQKKRFKPNNESTCLQEHDSKRKIDIHRPKDTIKNITNEGILKWEELQRFKAQVYSQSMDKISVLWVWEWCALAKLWPIRSAASQATRHSEDHITSWPQSDEWRRASIIGFHNTKDNKEFWFHHQCISRLEWYAQWWTWLPL
jgi:hypothetical protein